MRGWGQRVSEDVHGAHGLAELPVIEVGGAREGVEEGDGGISGTVAAGFGPGLGPLDVIAADCRLDAQVVEALKVALARRELVPDWEIAPPRACETHFGLLNAGGGSHAAGMTESAAPWVVILLGCVLGLLLLVAALVVRLSARLARIEQRLGGGQVMAAEAASPSSAETAAGGAFETFLSEDPARRALAKGEQFAAYRRWRQANGLNWSNS